MIQGPLPYAAAKGAARLRTNRWRAFTARCSNNDLDLARPISTKTARISKRSNALPTRSAASLRGWLTAGGAVRPQMAVAVAIQCPFHAAGETGCTGSVPAPKVEQGGRLPEAAPSEIGNFGNPAGETSETTPSQIVHYRAFDR